LKVAELSKMQHLEEDFRNTDPELWHQPHDLGVVLQHPNYQEGSHKLPENNI
jgi:hypothetical protein